jgi:hypothetical protein
MNYDPEGATESAGEAIAVLEREVQGDLERFRDFLESHGHETGAWRGQVQQSNGKHRKRAHVSASRLRSRAPAYWRFIASFLIFLASFFSLGVLAGSFFVAFLLSWLLLMMFAPG